MKNIIKYDNIMATVDPKRIYKRKVLKDAEAAEQRVYYYSELNTILDKNLNKANEDKAHADKIVDNCKKRLDLAKIEGESTKKWKLDLANEGASLFLKVTLEKTKIPTRPLPDPPPLTELAFVLYIRSRRRTDQADRHRHLGRDDRRGARAELRPLSGQTRQSLVTVTLTVLSSKGRGRRKVRTSFLQRRHHRNPLLRHPRSSRL